jgi:hypothetical protein
MTPTESLLKELEELSKEATSGPAEAYIDDNGHAHLRFPKIPRGFHGGCYGYLTYSGIQDAQLDAAIRNSLRALLQIIRTQREELERMAKVDVSLLSNELAAAWALRHWVFARDALSRCDEIAQTVSSLGAKGVKG